MIGTTLGHYRIVEKLGEGGMGVVYKAQDLHLDRPVALKLLPPEKVADPDRKRRFVQEAKAASALNHPNIVHIYDIDQSDGTDFIAMEYVEGKTLDTRIGHRGMRLSEALKCAVQVADALAKAHAAGIVHRDLKPTNIMVSADGVVKVLDFGLAKLTEPVLGDEAATTTGYAEAKPLTEAGAIVGTVAYMSPEQAEGKPVDARSDIFSLGSVLYELVTGQLPFQGPSKLSTLSAILQQEPKPPSAIAPAIPHDLEKLISRCLRKDPAKRLQHMDDVKIALEELKEESGSGRQATAPQVAKAGFRWRWAATVAAAAVALVAAAVWFWVSRSGVPRSETPAAAVPLTGLPGSELYPSFSRDGSEVAFAWNGDEEDNWDIYVKQIATGALKRLTDDPAADSSPAWSPDNRWIAFRRQRESGAAIVLMPSIGGQESTLTETTVANSFLSWTHDGKWLAFSDRASGEPVSIWAIEVESGARRRLTESQTIAQGTDYPLGDYCPSFSPDGHWLAFARAMGGYVYDLFVLPLEPHPQPPGEPTQITNEGYPVVKGLAWAPDSSEIVYSAGGVYSSSLWRVNVSGGQRPRHLLYTSQSALYPAVSPTAARLAYTSNVHDEHLWRLSIRTGERKDLIRSTNANQLPQYSPDGTKIAYTSYQSGNPEIWTCDANGADCRQLTRVGGPQCGAPRWSPDGQWLAFDSRAEGHSEIYVITPDGRQQHQVTDSFPFGSTVPSWSADARWIFFGCDRTGRNEIWKVPAGGGPAVQVTRSGGYDAQASPDGKYLYYARENPDSPYSLWRVAVDGGEEQQMLGRLLHWGNFAVTAKGIYFMPDAQTIRFLDTTTSKISLVATIDKPLGGVGGGICVSPHDAYLLWSQVAVDRSDLMLVEKFR